MRERKQYDLFEENLEEANLAMADVYPPRSEKREAVVRIVEYSPYPRIAAGERRQVGFTRNQSRSGLCIVTSKPQPAGTLLKVALRTVDGGAALDALAHVAWCEERRDGRYWMGLAVVERGEERMRKARRAEAREDAQTEGSGPGTRSSALAPPPRWASSRS